MRALPNINADYAGNPNAKRGTSGMIKTINESMKEAINIKLMCTEAEIWKSSIWEDNTACIHLGHGLAPL